jgi:hypothetical protein
MKERKAYERRILLLSVAGGALIAKSQVLALSLQPPGIEEIVPISHLVLVGSIQSYVFRGVLQSEKPEEYRIDYEDDENQRGRAMDVIVHIEEILLGKIPDSAPAFLRVHWPIPRQQRMAFLGDKRIFFLREPSLYTNRSGFAQALYGIIARPRPVSDEKQVLQEIKKLKSEGKLK